MIAQLDLFNAQVVQEVSQLEIELQFTSTIIPAKVLTIMSQADIQPSSNGWAVEVGQMQRKDYESFKAVVIALRGKWTGKTHWFPYNPSTVWEEVINHKRIPKANPFHLFETPDVAINDLFELMSFPTGSEYAYSILEPSAGPGAIARRVREALPNSIIDCCEIDVFNQKILRESGFNLIGSDFLKTTPTKQYDFVVMNPPFDGNAYMEHVQRAFQHLRTGGILGSIVPKSMLFGSTKKAKQFRNWVAEFGNWECIGSPFETTSVECLVIKVERYSAERLQDLWSRYKGYSSWFHYHFEIALDSDHEWYQAIEYAVKNIQDENEQRDYLGKKLDIVAEKMIREEICEFVYDDRVKGPLIESALETVREWNS